MARLAEIIGDVSAMYLNDHDMIDIPDGSVVEILEQYSDDGFWSDDDPSVCQNPFPAYVFRYNGLKYCSVHIKCFRELS